MLSSDPSSNDAPPADARLHLATLIGLSADKVDVLATSPFGPFVLHPCASLAEVRELLTAGECDALIVAADAAAEAQALAREIAPDVALLVIAPRLRGAIERKRDEREARKAYATDLETGLPHQQQFIEHVSQLLALREREP